MSKSIINYTYSTDKEGNLTTTEKDGNIETVTIKNKYGDLIYEDAYGVERKFNIEKEDGCTTITDNFNRLKIIENDNTIEYDSNGNIMSIDETLGINKLNVAIRRESRYGDNSKVYAETTSYDIIDENIKVDISKYLTYDNAVTVTVPYSQHATKTIHQNHPTIMSEILYDVNGNILSNKTYKLLHENKYVYDDKNNEIISMYKFEGKPYNITHTDIVYDNDDRPVEKTIYNVDIIDGCNLEKCFPNYDLSNEKDILYQKAIVDID